MTALICTTPLRYWVNEITKLTIQSKPLHQKQVEEKIEEKIEEKKQFTRTRRRTKLE